jgi:porin
MKQGIASFICRVRRVLDPGIVWIGEHPLVILLVPSIWLLSQYLPVWKDLDVVARLLAAPSAINILHAPPICSLLARVPFWLIETLTLGTAPAIFAEQHPSMLAVQGLILLQHAALWIALLFRRVVSIFFLLLCPFNSAAAEDTTDFIRRMPGAAQDMGYTFGAEYTSEVFANVTGGFKTGATYDGLLKLSMRIDLAKVAGWNGATLYGSMFYPHGTGLTDSYTRDFNRLSNIDAYDSLRLFELWFQQKLFGDQVSIRIGQIAADQEFYQSSTATLFLNSCFGTFPTISFGTNLPIYPVGGLGARIDYGSTSSLKFRAALFDSNPGIQSMNDKHGTVFHLNPSAGLILIAEGVYQVAPTPANCGLVGTYTLGGYYDSRPYTGQFVHPGHHANGGLYGIIDQVVYREAPLVDEKSSNQGLSIFTSCSIAPRDRNLVSFYLDGGCNYLGLFPTRDNDVIGIAISYTKLTDDFVQGGKVIHSGHETVIEASYKFQLNQHFFLQPDLQLILHPGAVGAYPNTLVTGLRFDLTF